MTDAATHADRMCPWTLLGVSPHDDPTTIRAAWRALVRSYHPDLARTDREAANRKLAEINAAFDAVCDREAAARQLAAARRAKAVRKAEEQRRAEARRIAEVEQQAQAARKAESARRNRATALNLVPLTQSWSRADRLAARAARQAFEGARRVFETAPASHRSAVYL